MLILIDKFIPFLNGVLEPYAEVRFLSPEEFTPAVVKDADALIVRTRTKCNRELLEGSKVRFIATATIGFDHIDTGYCDEHGIRWISCPGCNASAVCDYVHEVLETAKREGWGTSIKSIGVVGVGHVGSLVSKMAEEMGLQVVLNDPPKGLWGDVSGCDVVTFHTPLSKLGTYPTYHLCDETFLQKMRNPNALIINAARGGVVDEQALLRSGHPCVIDCWEGEPNLYEDLLLSSKTKGASYHIAGYSVLGKRNATAMSLSALCHFFGLPELQPNNDELPVGDSAPGWLNRITCELKSHSADFETLRKSYVLR